MKTIGNIYYRLYRFVSFLGEEDTPRYNAVLILSMFFMLNFLSVAIAFGILTNRIIFIGLPKIYQFCTGLLIIAINSYLIFGKKRYLLIEERHKHETSGSKFKNILIVWLYIIGTVALFVVLLRYLMKHPIM